MMSWGRSTYIFARLSPHSTWIQKQEYASFFGDALLCGLRAEKNMLTDRELKHSNARDHHQQHTQLGHQLVELKIAHILPRGNLTLTMWLSLGVILKLLAERLTSIFLSNRIIM